MSKLTLPPQMVNILPMAPTKNVTLYNTKENCLWIRSKVLDPKSKICYTKNLAFLNILLLEGSARGYTKYGRKNYMRIPSTDYESRL